MKRMGVKEGAGSEGVGTGEKGHGVKESGGQG